MTITFEFPLKSPGMSHCTKIICGNIVTFTVYKAEESSLKTNLHL